MSFDALEDTPVVASDEIDRSGFILVEHHSVRCAVHLAEKERRDFNEVRLESRDRDRTVGKCLYLEARIDASVSAARVTELVHLIGAGEARNALLVSRHWHRRSLWALIRVVVI